MINLEEVSRQLDEQDTALRVELATSAAKSAIRICGPLLRFSRRGWRRCTSVRAAPFC